THYQAAYDPKDVSDAESLAHYIKNPAYAHEADKLLVAAAREMQEKPRKAPMKYAHLSFIPPSENRSGETMQRKLDSLLQMDDGSVTVDTTFMPPADFARAWAEYRNFGAPCITKPVSMVDTSPGLRSL